MDTYRVRMYVKGTEDDAIALRKSLAQTVYDEFELGSVYGVRVEIDNPSVSNPVENKANKKALKGVIKKDFVLKVPYVSVWDGGCEIVTSAVLNIRTGEITEIESVEVSNALRTCEREYILLSGEQHDVISDGVDSRWVQLYHGHEGYCTESYLDHRDAMAELSVTGILRAVDYINTLSQFVNKDNEILDDLDEVINPFNMVLEKLKTDIICWHGGCNSRLYKSDLPQYDYVCPECDENC